MRSREARGYGPAQPCRVWLSAGIYTAIYIFLGFLFISQSCSISPNDECPTFCGGLLVGVTMGAQYIVLQTPALLLSFQRSGPINTAVATAIDSMCLALACFDGQIFIRTGQHIHNFMMPFAEMWSMTHGIRLALVEAVCLAGVLGFLMSLGLNWLLGRLMPIAIIKGPEPTTQKRRNICLLCFGFFGVLLMQILVDKSCFKPEFRPIRLAWDSMPFHLTSASCVSVNEINNDMEDKAAKAANHPAKIQQHDINSKLFRDDDFITMRAKNKQDIIMFIIDSLPAREFVDDAPEEARRTTFTFRHDVKESMEQNSCTLLPRHFAGSSYSDPGFYALFHSLLPIELDDKKFPWCMPVDLMKEAGYETSIFLNGPIGYDICEARHMADGAGTRRFEHSEIHHDDDGVTDGALAWLDAYSRNNTANNSDKDRKPFFMVVYYQRVHLLYSRRFSGIPRFEEAFREILEDTAVILDRSKMFDPLVVMTTDHGCARPGPHSDCPSCRGHGFQVLEDHATESIAHIPLWLCSPGEDRQGTINELKTKALSFNITSALDVMPSLLDMIQLDPMPPLHLWSNGRSWLGRSTSQEIEIDYSFAFSLSRLNCVLRVAMITLQSVFYHASKMHCLFKSNISSCMTFGKSFEMPAWSEQARQSNRTEFYNQTYRENVMLQRIIIPSQNRLSLPYPPTPAAFLLRSTTAAGTTDPASSGGACLVVNADRVPGVAECPTAFYLADNYTMPFLWNLGPEGKLYQVASHLKLEESLLLLNGTFLAKGNYADEVLSLCRRRSENDDAPNLSLKFARLDHRRCSALKVERPWVNKILLSLV